MSIHDIRVFNIAIIDVVGTILIAVLIYKYKIVKCSFLTILFLLFILGIAVHYILGIDTTLNYKLGLSNKPARYRSGKFFDIVSPK